MGAYWDRRYVGDDVAHLGPIVMRPASHSRPTASPIIDSIPGGRQPQAARSGPLRSRVPQYIGTATRIGEGQDKEQDRPFAETMGEPVGK